MWATSGVGTRQNICKVRGPKAALRTAPPKFRDTASAQVLLRSADGKVMNRCVPSPLSLIPGTLVLVVVVVAHKLYVLFAL